MRKARKVRPLRALEVKIYFENNNVRLFGGSCWIRTNDLLVKSQLLYRLS